MSPADLPAPARPAGERVGFSSAGGGPRPESEGAAEAARSEVDRVLDGLRREPRPSRSAFLRAELAVRVSLLSANSVWRDPALYAHPLVGDDFWLLAGRWDSYCGKIDPLRIHPRLGWTQGPLLPQNPLGLEPYTTERLQRDGRKKVLFYGDSFVAGHAAPEAWLPALLERALDDTDVLHLGVGGYGPDQMHLLARETLHRVDRPDIVLMGIMTHSFDRVDQRIRSYQKPVVVPRADGSLAVENVPIDPDPERFFKRARPSFRSYLEAAERMRAEPPERDDYGFARKAVLNRAIIRANRMLAEAHGAALVYVLFHDHADLFGPTSRREFFLDALVQEGVPVFDTAAVLLEHRKQHGGELYEFYSGGHHNDAGNILLAPALARRLAELGLVQLPHRERSA